MEMPEIPYRNVKQKNDADLNPIQIFRGLLETVLAYFIPENCNSEFNVTYLVIIIFNSFSYFVYRLIH